MAGFSPFSALMGGVLIGLSAVALYAALGRIAGMSGIIGQLIRPVKGDIEWRVLFLGGLLAGAGVLRWVAPATLGVAQVGSLTTLGVAGLCTGFGTRMANGCTSGHGVVGLSRLSVRSVVATGTFMAAAMVVVFVTRHVGVGR